MKRTLTVLGTAALIGGSLVLGAGPANAGTCPAGQHWNEMGGGAGFCSPDASGGGTGGSVTIDLGGTNPPAPQAPAFPNPNGHQAPVYQAPPVRVPVPQQPAPPALAPVRVPAPQAPASGYAPAYSAPGGSTVQKNAQGVWVDPATGAVADAGLVAEAEAASLDIEAPAAAPAAVLPVTEVQAVEVLRSVTATAPEKEAALAIVKARIDDVLGKALEQALARH